MIFYFSGTGNTQWVTRQIADGINEEMLAIPDLVKQERYDFILEKGERIGFCFPTHGWQVPRIVRLFIRHLRITGQGYCWAVTTCGDDIGETMTILNKELSKRGLKAEALFSVIMPESYVCLPFMHTDTKEREEQKIKAAREQTKHIVETVQARVPGIEELKKGPTPRLYSYVIGSYFNRKMVNDRKFTVDTGMCIQCGKCQRVCPVDNIKNTPPQWIHDGRCTCCLACYHHCPVHAINYGNITKDRGQYYFNRREDRK